MIALTNTTIMTELALMVAGGVLGQLARVVVGLYKKRVSEGENWEVDWKFAGLSLGLGAVVGVIAGVFLETTDLKVLVLAGYAGVDFIEGIFNRRIEESGIKKS